MNDFTGAAGGACGSSSGGPGAGLNTSLECSGGGRGGEIVVGLGVY